MNGERLTRPIGVDQRLTIDRVDAPCSRNPVLHQPGLPVHGYVGDTVADQRAAAAACYRFAAVSYGYGGDLDAVHRISSPLELLQLSLCDLPW